MTNISTLTADLAQSAKRPGSRTLRLLDKALRLLHPFESPRAQVTSPSERQDLLSLLSIHRDILSPYINLDKVESNLRHTKAFNL